MTVGLRLELKQSQQLVMTPQLQQAIRLLQMSNLELADFVESQIAENPLIAREGSDDGEAAEPAPRDSSEPITLDDAGPELAAEVFDTGAENLVDTSPSDGPSPFLSDSGWQRGGSAPASAGDDGQWLENRESPERDLRTHLLAQIGHARAGPAVLAVARALVEELDDHGYLRTPLKECADRFGATPAMAEAALAVVQTCEPTGVGARDLGECLALQLAERDRLDPAMLKLTRHLDLAANGELKRLQRLCGVDDEDMAEMLAELRTLDPRPCSGFGGEEAATLIPDVFVRRTDWGGWQVELNAETLPRVIVDNAYAVEIEAGGCAETRRFVSECRSNASWLVRSLDQRAKTILKVASEIVRRQEGFFNEGVTALRPMNLRMVADAIGMHESTASRVTSGKYMATERGVFELKFFFTNAVGGGDGEEGGNHSAAAVRHRIKAMIDAETPGKILSDDTIVEMLGREGVEIARRTVAKYRSALDIPSSVERRRRKAISGGR